MDEGQRPEEAPQVMYTVLCVGNMRAEVFRAAETLDGTEYLTGTTNERVVSKVLTKHLHPLGYR